MAFVFKREEVKQSMSYYHSMASYCKGRLSPTGRIHDSSLDDHDDYDDGDDDDYEEDCSTVLL